MFDLIPFIKTLGYLGIFSVVFAESGLFIGFFLPGDSLLFTAGFLASRGFLNITLLVAISAVGAISGDSIGYLFGKKIGTKIFSKEDSFLFHKDNIHRAEAFFAKYGSKTIILARFVPVVRTFAPILAGVGNMPYRTFIAFNIIGGLIWGVGLPLLGYFLGNSIPNIDHYLLPLIITIIILSVSPSFFHIYHIYQNRKNKNLKS